MRTHNSLIQSFALCALPLFAAGFLFAQEDPADPKAMAELARRYQHGIGCPRDIARALHWYKRAAEQNDPGAMVALGDIYNEGVCVDQDVKYARSMYRRAAQLGFPPGMTRHAESLPFDDSVAWYRKAAQTGYAPAMTKLGDLLGDMAWYRRAVQAQDPPAFAKLAENVPSEEALGLLQRGAELKDPVAMRQLAFRSTGAQAASLFREAAEAGDVEAMERIAYLSERAGERGEALRWYTKAAEAGHVRARFWLARRAGDVEPALLRAAAEAADPEALFMLGNVDAAAALGHPEALAKLGRFEEAANAGHPGSLLKLGRIKEAAERGNPEAMYRYGSGLEDRAEAMRWIAKAAEARHVPAMCELGVAYRSGQGIAADEALSEKWLRAAAEAGDPEALFRLGDAESMKRAAAAGHAEAKFRTGSLEPESAAKIGIPDATLELARRARKPKEAYLLAVKAAEAGSAEAMMMVGDCHLNARGTWRSEIDAVHWYRRAALAGSKEALEKLKKLGYTL